ncbi:MAG: GNAT family N-acetyltransferase [Marinibacterium sp.]|nr:GNAT family N-acetyltransferase [Marinibacterium sp.]
MRQIRDAGPQDLPGLLHLYRDLHVDDAPPTPDEAARILADIAALRGSAVLIAEDAGGMLASCTLMMIPNLTRAGRPYGLVENVVTAAAHRGQGHGQAVLRAAIDRAWQAGCYKVMLLTGRCDPGTLAFYRAAGFEQSKTGFQIRAP